ncbi:MAG: GPP34 family phosphoprotein [Streptosporangiaceae bacterium]|nr:GPP34 family phosphoprotein [Streptosporangiaceae bacterium]
MADLSGTGRLADDLYLMAHDEVSGKPFVQSRALGLGLASALLAELMLPGLISINSAGITPARPMMPEDTVTRDLLNLLLSERDVHPVREWLLFVGRNAAEGVAGRLAASGYLVQSNGWGRPWRGKRWVAVDENCAFAPMLRVRAALDATRLPPVHGAVLAGLATACGLGFRIAQYALPEQGRSVEETVELLASGLRELIAQTRAAVDSAVLSHRV